MVTEIGPEKKNPHKGTPEVDPAERDLGEGLYALLRAETTTRVRLEAFSQRFPKSVAGVLMHLPCPP